MTLIQKVAGVVLRGGLLLVVRKRGSEVFLSPGGKPEPGEDSLRTLARELSEEAGVRLVSAEPFGTFTDQSALERAAVVRIEAYLATVQGVAVPSSEIEEVAWVDAGYRDDGLALGSVLDRFVVPELRRRGMLRERAPRPRGSGVVAAVALDGALTFGGGTPGPAVAAALTALAARSEVKVVVTTARAMHDARAALGALAGRVELRDAGDMPGAWSGEPPATVIALGSGLDDQALLGRADAAVVVGDGLPGLERAGHVRRVPATDAGVAAALEAEVRRAGISG